MMNDEQWIDKLRERFAEYGQPEPEGLWEDIEREMGSKRRPTVLPSRSRILYRGIGAAAAMIALLLWVGRVAFYPEPPETGTVTPATIAENQPQPEIPVHRNGPPSKETRNRRQSLPDITHQPVVSDTGPVAGAEPEYEQATGLESTGRELPESRPEEKSKPATPAIPVERLRATGYGDNEIPFVRNRPAKRGGPGWSARILASNVPGSGSKRLQGGYGALAGATPQPGMYGDEMSLTNSMIEFLILNQDRETYTETDHRQPLRAGLMLSYGLTDKLSIEGGLTYTYLGSRLKSGSERNYYETQQSLHYLGIPVGLRYSLWENRLLNVYLSGGGMVEKSVSGSASTDYVHNGEAVSKDSRRVSIDGLQWSMNAAAGLQLNISRTVGLFAEPGIGYHFDNGSPVETIYKKKPLNFDLTFGLRISFRKSQPGIAAVAVH